MNREINFPENHPLRKVIRNLTDRALTQSKLPDKDLHIYLTNLLVDFMEIEKLYKLRDNDGERLEYLVDMLVTAQRTAPHLKKSYYQQIGDHTLFMLGMFPESLERPRRSVSPSYYSDTGRLSYLKASDLESNHNTVVVYRKLAAAYGRCVLTLNWFREYTTVEFYQYMFRQFGIT